MKNRLTSLLAPLLVVISLVLPVQAHGQDPVDTIPAPYDLGGGYVITMEGGQRHCRVATFEETQEIRRKSPDTELHYLQPEKAAKAHGAPAGGLTILLRSTTQLDSFPVAKNAYIRAAETWEALVKTPITIVIDVDFGPKRFGQTYPPGVLGSTSSQFGNFLFFWSAVRPKLIAGASNQAEADLYSKLPPTSGIPTTKGTSTSIYIPSSVQRALGLIAAVANPDAEENRLGDPPSIGFNSAFLYDFDPTDGIDSNKLDFNATAVHELGHALGFDSWAGLTELDSSAPNLVTTWDLFRFRSGVTIDSFTSSQRVVSSGGEQIQFAGGGNTRLSTGRPDGSGGDGFQASHWKERHLNGNQYIGIMDPAGSDGDKDQLTAIDLATLDLLGFDVRGLVSFEGAVPSLSGNTLTIGGNGIVANLVLASATVKLLDANGQTLTTLSAIPLNMKGSSFVPLSLNVPGLENFLSATMAEVTVVDDKGNSSAPLRFDISAGDAGGARVDSVKYNGKKLTILGAGFTAPVQLEVNGVVVGATVKVKKQGAKLNIKGSVAALGLQSGANRIRFLSGGVHSNFVILNN